MLVFCISRKEPHTREATGNKAPGGPRSILTLHKVTLSWGSLLSSEPGVAPENCQILTKLPCSLPTLSKRKKEKQVYLNMGKYEILHVRKFNAAIFTEICKLCILVSQ